MGNGFLSPYKALASLGFFPLIFACFPPALGICRPFDCEPLGPPRRHSSPSHSTATALTYRQTADKTDDTSQRLLVPRTRTQNTRDGKKEGTGVFVSFRQLRLTGTMHFENDTITLSYDHYVCASSGVSPFKMTVSQHAVRRVTVVNLRCEKARRRFQHDTSGARGRRPSFAFRGPTPQACWRSASRMQNTLSQNDRRLLFFFFFLLVCLFFFFLTKCGIKRLWL